MKTCIQMYMYVVQKARSLHVYVSEYCFFTSVPISLYWLLLEILHKSDIINPSCTEIARRVLTFYYKCIYKYKVRLVPLYIVTKLPGLTAYIATAYRYDVMLS